MTRPMISAFVGGKRVRREMTDAEYAQAQRDAEKASQMAAANAARRDAVALGDWIARRARNDAALARERLSPAIREALAQLNAECDREIAALER